MTFNTTLRDTRPWTQPVFLSMLCLMAFCESASTAESPDWDLTPLEPAPEWARIIPFQGTISRSGFQDELERVFLVSPGDAQGLIQVSADHALITTQARSGQTLRVDFGSKPRPASVYWRTPSELPPLRHPDKPLQDLRVVIDPGHIGGAWAPMENRSFQIPVSATQNVGSGGVTASNSPVKEGDLVLRVAELLEDKLSALGARVAFVRRRLEPVTPLRPADLLDPARKLLGFPGQTMPEASPALRLASERLFYLSAEIRARGERVNQEFRPDLALCLHLNAEPWSNPAQPSLVDRDHFHILINGCYTRSELTKDDQRFLLIHRILQRIHPEELALAEETADIMAPRLGLPPYEYRGTSAKRPGPNPYIWCRNLLATRIYHCPVIYFEPYVMNARITHARIQAGEYVGTRSISGKEYPNLFEEYASGVAEGIASYYRKRRSPSPHP